jgi:carbonic anhydrase/acetyltransferase-like protein (isoleucine patch superfamily)
VVPPDMVVPDRMLVVGVPGRIARPINDKDLQYMRWLTMHYVELAEKYVKNEDPVIKSIISPKS